MPKSTNVITFIPIKYMKTGILLFSPTPFVNICIIENKKVMDGKIYLYLVFCLTKYTCAQIIATLIVIIHTHQMIIPNIEPPYSLNKIQTS